jgi:hypothetical protein
VQINDKNPQASAPGYLPDSGLGAGFGAGFFAGLETPMLIRKKLKPLRSESSILMFKFLSVPIRLVRGPSSGQGSQGHPTAIAMLSFVPS